MRRNGDVRGVQFRRAHCRMRPITLEVVFSDVHCNRNMTWYKLFSLRASPPAHPKQSPGELTRSGACSNICPISDVNHQGLSLWERRVLEAAWGNRGALWGPCCRPLEPLWCSPGALLSSWGAPGALLEALGALTGQSWRPWASLVLPCGPLRALLGHS